MRWSSKCNNFSVFFPAVTACECFNYLVPLIWGKASLCINGHPQQCAAAAEMEPPPARAGSWLASCPDALAFTEHLILVRKFGQQTPLRFFSRDEEGNAGIQFCRMIELLVHL